MDYLREFQAQIANHDYSAILRLWEEYCASDEIDPEEFSQILLALKNSEFAESFGRHVDRALPLWEKTRTTPAGNAIIRLIIDLESTNSPQFAQIAYDYLQEKYSGQKFFHEKIRLIGLRTRDRFQGAISNYELLTHIDNGRFVFHTGGWGVGEIIDFSLVREQMGIEFDYVPGKKDISFETAFKSLIPIADDHFLALRFGSPDLLEQKARENPAEVIRLLLRDLGPKNAAEIKDELCDLVIPAKEWTRWWQGARAKIKKDTMIETPEELRNPFRLRNAEVTHEERLSKALENKPDASTLIQMVYTFMKDFPETLKNATFRSTLQGKLTQMLSFQEITNAQELQIHFFIQDLGSEKEYAPIAELLKRFSSIEEVIQQIDILSLKKRMLMEVRKVRPDWKETFLHLLLVVDQSPLRDYIVTELFHSDAKEELNKKLTELLNHPARYPDALIWYFQKIMGETELPFHDTEGRKRFFESLLILLSSIEANPTERDLVKKIHALLAANRYAMVRQLMQTAAIEEAKEFLLLATKCHSLGDHDIKILHSLAEVVHPSLTKLRKKQDSSGGAESQTIWTTQEGYLKLQQRIQQVATVETVENAKEIEVARSHGDLRENAEFKAALEKRDRLQSELKTLTEQLNRARVLVKEEIMTDHAGVGCVVECKNSKGEKISYTILGPWDADPERNILSFQSKLASSIKGLKVGDTFQFQDEKYTIGKIRSALK